MIPALDDDNLGDCLSSKFHRICRRADRIYGGENDKATLENELFFVIRPVELISVE